jgi:uncharacterized membrane protein
MNGSETKATVDVTTAIEIARPVAEVAAYAADPDNVPRWYVNITAVEWQTPRPLQIGSRIAFVAQFLGRRLAYTYEVVEWRPRELLIMRTSSGPFPMETTYAWTPLGEMRTRMTLRNRGAPRGWSRIIALFMAAAIRRANRKDLALLKNVLEGTG